jgi:Glycosyltransferase family 87
VEKRHWVRRAAWAVVILTGVLFRAHIVHGLPREVELCAADFSAFYSGGALVGSPQLYSPGAAFAVQEQSIGCHHENLVFIKPPFYALLMWPFAQLPFVPAFYLFRVLVLVGVAVFLWMWPGDRWAAAAACAWSVPLAATFTVGQDVVFVLVAVLGAYRMLRSGRQFAAGALLGLCAIKFHLFLLLPVLLLRWRLWKTVAGGAAVGVVWFAMCFAAAGPRWIAAYRAALSGTRINPYTFNMVNLRGLFGYDSPWIWPAAAGVAIVCGYLIWRGSLEVGLSVVLAGGVLITPHTTVCDATLFLPCLLLARRMESATARTVAVFALTPMYLLLPGGTMQVAVMAILIAAVWELRGAPSVPCQAAPWRSAIMEGCPH